MASSGFTLIEVLLSTVIIAILVGLSLPIYLSFQNRNELDLTTQSIADSLRRAQTYSRAVRDDSAWSVNVQSGAATLFRGTSFSTRDTTEDEATTIVTPITPSGLSEVQFSKLTGLPNTTGTITLTNGNESRTVTINAKGMVTY